MLPTVGFPKLSLSFVAFAVYLFVINSYKIQVAQEALVVGMLALLIEPGRLRWPPGFFWCLGFLAWAGISAANSEYSPEAWSAWQDFGKLLLIFLVAANAARTASQVSAFLIFWLACFAMWPVRGTLFNFAYGIGEFGRYAWNFIYGNPNDLAAIVLLMLGLTMVAWRSSGSRPVRLAGVMGTAILTVIMFLTQSRGGFLALTVFALLAVTTHHRRVRAALGLATLAALVLAVAPSSVWERLGGLRSATSTSTLADVDPEGSAESRYQIWRISLRITSDHPAVGVGFGAYSLAHREYASRGGAVRGAIFGKRDTHSTYLNALAETGVLGLLLLLGFIVGFAVFLARTAARLVPKSQRQAEQFKYLFAAWVSFWVAGVFGTFHRIAIPYVFAGFATALAAQYGALGRESEATVARAPRPAPRPALRSRNAARTA